MKFRYWVVLSYLGFCLLAYFVSIQMAEFLFGKPNALATNYIGKSLENLWWAQTVIFPILTVTIVLVGYYWSRSKPNRKEYLEGFHISFFVATFILIISMFN